jgi:hypothetical protein
MEYLETAMPTENCFPRSTINVVRVLFAVQSVGRTTLAA